MIKKINNGTPSASDFYSENYFMEAIKEDGFDGEKMEPQGWDDDGEDTSDESFEEAMSFWSGSIMEADSDSFIEPTKAPGTVDETIPNVGPEKDQYKNDPAKDTGLDDFMKNDGPDETITIESDFDDEFDEYF